MIELRVIAVGKGSLLLGGATSVEARYRVPLTDAVRRAIVAQDAAEERDLAAQPLLGPAQVQARLRAGMSTAEVAREARADIAWVERWEGPVQAERDQVIRGALAATVADGNRTTSDSLEQLVRAWLPTGADASAVEWSTARRRDGRWRVSMRFVLRGKPLTATWLWDTHAKRATPASARARSICGVTTGPTA